MNASTPRAILFAAVALANGWGARADAAPPCLDADNQCEPDKLCTFEQQLAEKILIQQIYKANRPSLNGGRGGPLYQESVAEAAQRAPMASASERADIAGQLLQEKVQKMAQAQVTIPRCERGSFDPKYLPKVGYNAMFTNEHCEVRVDFESGDYPAEGFGADHVSACPEFYDRDRAHEAIHQSSCKAAKKKGDGQNLNINRIIQDEIKAYEHSIKVSKAYVRLLSLLCSADAPPEKKQMAAARYRDLLGPYLTKAN